MPVFSPASLTETTASIFAAAGMRADEARVVAELLVVVRRRLDRLLEDRRV